MKHTWLILAAAGIMVAQAQVAASATTPADAAIRGVEMQVRAEADPAAPGTQKLNLTLHNGAPGTQAFQLAVLQRGDAAEATAAQKARTGWKEDYLFVRDDCLQPAGASRPWRCVLDRVFTLVEGADAKVRRLVYIGEVHAGDDCADDARFGCSLYDRIFTDIYDKFETNPVAPRGESPALLLEMRVRNGEFVVDLDETWGRNQERYIAGFRCLAAAAAERAAACTDGIAPRGAYLFNAVLAAYTQRADQLARIHAFARSALCDGANDEACGEKLRLSALMLAAVRPGERPGPRGGVTTSTPPRVP